MRRLVAFVGRHWVWWLPTALLFAALLFIAWRVAAVPDAPFTYDF